MTRLEITEPFTYIVTVQMECLSQDVNVPGNRLLHDPQVFWMYLGHHLATQWVFI